MTAGNFSFNSQVQWDVDAYNILYNINNKAVISLKKLQGENFGQKLSYFFINTENWYKGFYNCKKINVKFGENLEQNTLVE